MSIEEAERFVRRSAKEVVGNDRVLSMKGFTQHGETSTYEHCLYVAALSFLIVKMLRLKVDIVSLVVGAMLHDFFLYDWHDGKQIEPGLFGVHCFYHPRKALENAKETFDLTWKEENIIRSHMFPTTLLHPPRCKEAWVVCVADKACALAETFGWKKRKGGKAGMYEQVKDDVEIFKENVLKELENNNATDVEKKLVSDEMVKNAIKNGRRPEDVAWAIIQ